MKKTLDILVLILKTNLLKNNLDPDYSRNDIEKFTIKENYNEFLQEYK